jgi:hypothetical protein
LYKFPAAPASLRICAPGGGPSAFITTATNAGPTPCYHCRKTRSMFRARLLGAFQPYREALPPPGLRRVTITRVPCSPVRMRLLGGGVTGNGMRTRTPLPREHGYADEAAPGRYTRRANTRLAAALWPLSGTVTFAGPTPCYRCRKTRSPVRARFPGEARAPYPASPRGREARTSPPIPTYSVDSTGYTPYTPAYSADRGAYGRPGAGNSRYNWRNNHYNPGNNHYNSENFHYNSGNFRYNSGNFYYNSGNNHYNWRNFRYNPGFFRLSRGTAREGRSCFLRPAGNWYVLPDNCRNCPEQ